MLSSLIKLLLADDDNDDCLLFRDALEELPINADLTIVNNGEQLMEFLQKSELLPSVLFLDLNMPRKNGFECLCEIRQNETMDTLPVIIFSTSFNHEIVRQLYQNGAHYYIRKPNEFEELKNTIQTAVSYVTKEGLSKPAFEDFVLISK